MTTRRLFTLLAFLTCVSLAYAKGPVDLILIAGGGLSQPISITDTSSLQSFNPWVGQFADWQQEAITDAPCARRSFSVKFFMKWPERHDSESRGDLQMIYATRYCSTGSSGYVYLPGPGQTLYYDNAGTIMRGDADGKWHPATSSWTSLIMNLVAAQDPQRGPDMIMIAGGELQHPIQITDAELLRTFDPWEGVFVNWNKPAAVGHCSWEYEIFYYKKGIESSTPYDRGDLHMIYGLRYCLDADGGPGYAHLADENDRFGPENMQSVYDGKARGKWHPSTAAWNRFIRSEIASQTNTSAHLH